MRDKKENTPIHKRLIPLLRNTFKKKYKTLNDIFYGLTVYELEIEIKKERGRLNNLLMLTVFGDLAGLPLFPSYYSMRILPHIIPLIDKWKRNINRERDVTDFIATDL
jgi:hypothetical protein